MAEQGHITEVRTEIRFNGTPIREGQPIPGPGRLEFVEIIRRPDGSEVPIVETLDIPAELLEQEEISMTIKTTIPDLAPGDSIPIEYEVKGYPDALIASLSTTGNARPEDFKPIARLNPEETKFTLPVPDKIESDDCYLVLEAIHNRVPVAASLLSNKFSIKAAVPTAFSIDPIKPEIFQGEQIQGSFTFTSSKKPLRFEIILLSASRGLTRKVAVIPPNERTFSFPAPADVEASDCRLSCVVYNISDIPFKTAVSNTFKITKGAAIEIELLQPGRGDKLRAGSNAEIKWRLLGPRRDFETDLIIAYSTNTTYEVIAEKRDAGTIGTAPWKVPLDIPENHPVRIRMTLPKEKAEQEFGPFFVVGGAAAKPPSELPKELENVDALLKGIRLPGKGLLSNRVSVGTFLYYLINSNELSNYVVAANRLRDIGRELENPTVQTKIGELYGEYASHLQALESMRKRVEGLERAGELKASLEEFLSRFIPTINQELLEDFRKHHGVDIRLRANIITQKGKKGLKYLNWVMERAQMIEGLAQVPGGIMWLYNNLESLQEHTVLMLAHLRAMRTIANKIRKALR